MDLWVPLQDIKATRHSTTDFFKHRKAASLQHSVCNISLRTQTCMLVSKAVMCLDEALADSL